jgi:hypothetical protein
MTDPKDKPHTMGHRPAPHVPSQIERDATEAARVAAGKREAAKAQRLANEAAEKPDDGK